MLLLYLFKK